MNPIDVLYNDFLRGLDITHRILLISDYSEGLKYGWKRNLDYSNQNISKDFEAGKSPKKKLKFYIDELSSLWSSFVDIWSEMFWTQIEETPTTFKRVDTIRKIIDRGRFMGVGEAMHTRYEWERLLDSGHLQLRYTSEELQKVTDIISKDESKRLRLLKKSLNNERVNWSEYLQYGEAIAYFTHGTLFNETTGGTELEKHFSSKEIRILDEIWKQYEPK